jgi:hypothetical protein
MPARNTGERAPNLHVTAGDWPDADLDGTEAAIYAQHVARQLRDAIGTRSRKEIARLSGLSDVTIEAALSGRNYVDVRTLARLESALGKPLLPNWPKRRRV